MVFQEPMTALNPVERVGDQIREVLEIHTSPTRSSGARACSTSCARSICPIPSR